MEIDNPDLTSLALSFKGHLAWMLDDPQGVIALSRAARRDKRVFIAQHAYNAHQEARGWAIEVIDTASNTVVATIPQLAHPFLPAVTPEGKNLFVPNHGIASVSVVATASNTVVTQIEVARNSHA